MMNGRIKVLGWIALAGVLASFGCASRDAQRACWLDATVEEATLAAHEVLAGMQFPIEKLDTEQGIIKTRPLRAGQFFEFWRRDNVGAYNAAEANLQSIRRTVELQISRKTVDHNPQAGGSSSLNIACDVHVQRLALPTNEVAGVSRAYLMHTRSTRTLQVIDVTPEQQEGMAWIDLGRDPQLAAEILRRIERKLEH